MPSLQIVSPSRKGPRICNPHKATLDLVPARGRQIGPSDRKAKVGTEGIAQQTNGKSIKKHIIFHFDRNHNKKRPQE